MHPVPRLAAVAAMTPQRVIGANNQLPWHYPEDLRWFKELTAGHTVIMGRKTFESLGKPLPRRRNLVLSRAHDFAPEGVEVFAGPRSLLAALAADEQAFVIGGCQIYAALLPFTREIYLTRLRREYPGDTWFPPFEDEFAPPRLLRENEDFEILHYLRP